MAFFSTLIKSTVSKVVVGTVAAVSAVSTSVVAFSVDALSQISSSSSAVVATIKAPEIDGGAGLQAIVFVTGLLLIAGERWRRQAR